MTQEELDSMTFVPKDQQEAYTEYLKRQPTKREQFAAMAMQGLLMAARNTIDRGYIIQNSVDYA